MKLPTKYTVEQRKALKADYKGLLKDAGLSEKEAKEKNVEKAFLIAADAHKDMFRKSGEPYMHHPIAVARIVAKEVGLGSSSIIAALLHDTVEDTEITLEDIEIEFDKVIAKMIDGLTKISTMTETTESIQAENFRKIIFTLGDDIRVIIIKLADRLHNMRTLASVPQRKQLKVASETVFLYAPLAHRLGLYNIKTELEDLSMKYRESKKYKEIAQQLNEKKNERDKYIEAFCEPVRALLKKHKIKARVFGRPKSIASIANKMRKKGVEFDAVFDLFAIRVIVDTTPEKEKMDIFHAYSLIAAHYDPNPSRFRNWVSHPKANGYESLHTTVMGDDGRWIEVQIRSERMDQIAEKGLAAHWKYKEGKGKGKNNQVDKAFESWLVQVRESLKDPNTNPIEFMRNFKDNLFVQEIYVFTPTGEVKNIPKGATALDFAFWIHTAVGSRCVGAKVNSKLVPISHVLENGDQIHILTSNKQKPNEDWLNFVITSRAKSKIKQSLKEERKKVAEDGKTLLMRKLKSIKANFNGENVQFLTQQFNMPSALEFYYNIATEKISLADLKSIPLDRGNFTKPKPVREPKANKLDDIVDFTQLNRSRTSKEVDENSQIIFSDGAEDLAYEFAKCCEPIPGDDVIGFVSVNGGVKIHRTSCKNLIHLSANYGYRLLKTEWSSKSSSSFLARLSLKGTDDMGLINQITNIISKDYRVNIKGMNIESNDNVWLGYLQLFVKDDEQLTAIMRRLKSLNGILSVRRILEGEDKEANTTEE